MERGGKLLSYLFNFRPRGNNIHCVREPRHDTVPDGYCSKPSRNLPFYATCQTLSPLQICLPPLVSSRHALIDLSSIDRNVAITSSVSDRYPRIYKLTRFPFTRFRPIYRVTVYPPCVGGKTWPEYVCPIR